MAASVKEINCTLFDQLSIVERIEQAMKEGGEQAGFAAIEEEKKQINRKLYQNPGLDAEVN